MSLTQPLYQPELTDAGLHAAEAVTAVDESGRPREGHIAAERALTLYLNKREIITLMTLGTNPELLVLGWLKNQRLIRDLSEIKALQVDWETDSAAITTVDQVADLDEKMGRKTVTTGCGQGTVFGARSSRRDASGGGYATRCPTMIPTSRRRRGQISSGRKRRCEPRRELGCRNQFRHRLSSRQTSRAPSHL